jgi:hypothetical protein
VNEVAGHALGTDPDVGLDVFHDVADVEMAISVRQCRRHKNLTFLHDRNLFFKKFSKQSRNFTISWVFRLDFLWFCPIETIKNSYLCTKGYLGDVALGVQKDENFSVN